MKNLIYTLALIFVSNLVLGQTDSENYVKTTTYQVKTTDGTTKAENSATLQADDKIESITYFDGLGRPIQSIAKQAGGNKEDIITPVAYDEFGRQVKDYLPYTRNNSSLNYDSSLLPDVNGEILPINTFYSLQHPNDLNISSPNPFSEKVLEESPLNRILEQAAPGEDWAVGSGHTIKFDYQTNTYDINDPNNNVKLFSVSHPNNDTEQTELIYNGHYHANELYKNITKDENWTSGKDHATEEFKNMQGQVILKRTYNDSIAHDTYYVYDKFGNLTFVLSPEASDQILDSNDDIKLEVLDNLCYQYHYDYRNRLIEKKIPGKGWEHIVYDVLDRPVLTQDANLRLTNDWLFTKYDKFNRVIYTGKHYFDPPSSEENAGRIALQDSVNGFVSWSESKQQINNPTVINGTNVYYSNKVIPFEDIEVYTINYYDDYNWDTQDSYEASYDLNDISPLLDNYTNPGQITRLGTGDAWNQGFTTQGEIKNDGYIQWTVGQNDKKLMIGLSRIDSAPDHNSNSIDYAIFLKDDGFYVIYEEGVYIGLPNTSSYSYNANDVFRVERSLDQITYYKNDVAFYASTVPSTGILIGDSSFLTVGAMVKDVFIGYSSLRQPFALNTKGLATGSKVKILGSSKWTTNTSYYDTKARNVYTISRNEFLNTIDAVSNYFDFTGKVIKSHSTHSSKNIESAIVTIDNFRYDHAGRLIRHEQQINSNNKELLYKNNYDELGQLEQKQVGGELPNSSAYNNDIGVSIVQKEITKSASSGWNNNSGVSTIDSISNDGYVSFTPVSFINFAFMAGLSYVDIDQRYQTIDYALQLKWDGFVTVWEKGISRGVKTRFVIGDIFTVERRDNTIYYLKNGESFYVSEVETTSEPLIGDAAFNQNGTTIKDFFIVDLEKELQEVDYSYNIRGWLKQINEADNLGTDLFGFGINYNTGNLTNTPLYNGNISETHWATANDGNLRSYDYQYDALNRITDANYHGDYLVNGIDENYEDYSVYGIEYKKNGNIHKLNRIGLITANNEIDIIDNLSYFYKPYSNQLEKVNDPTGIDDGFKKGNTTSNKDYEYDINGNMTKDLNKGIIRIGYNHLNLPVVVDVDNGEGAQYNGRISYIYDATGTKLAKIVNDTGAASTKVTEYAGNYIYEQSGVSSNYKLKFFSHPEGYIQPINENDISQGFEYVYQYKDHLGNIRLSYSDSQSNYQSLINSAFYEDYEGWTFSGGNANGSIVLENEQLKVNVKNQYNGAVFNVGDDFSVGDQISLSFSINNGSTDVVRVFLQELDANGNHLSWHVIISNNLPAETHTYTYTHTIVSGPQLRLKFDKSNTSNDVGQDTYFYIDNVFANSGSLEIIEENNYYPFGLRHRGYNNVVTSTNIALKKTYNGKELQDELDLNTFDLGARHMDPALGRFMTIDPMADFVTYQSPYAMADNNPIGFVDEYGLGSGVGDFLRSIFGGGCSCKGKGTGGRKAKKKKKASMKRNIRINKKIARRKNKKNKTKSPTSNPNSTRVATTTPQDGPRPLVDGIDVTPRGLLDLGGNLDFGLPELRIPEPAPAIPEFNGIPITDPISFNRDVKFKPSRSEFKDVDYTEKTLRDLIKTLKEYPQLKVLILGNTSYDTSSTVTTGTGAMVNGSPGTVGQLQLTRARAVEQFLINNGIDWRRISVGNGTINTTGGTSNMSSTFILSNSDN